MTKRWSAPPPRSARWPTPARQDLRERAAARDAGTEDPGPIHERDAAAALRAALDDEGIEAERGASATRALEQGLAEGLEGWRDQLQAARRRADTLVAKRLAELRRAEEERGRVRSAHRLVAALGAEDADLAYSLRKTGRPVVGLTDVPDARNANAPLGALELIDALERYLEASSTEAEAQQAADRIVQAEQDERDRQEIADYRRQFPGVAVPGS